VNYNSDDCSFSFRQSPVHVSKKCIVGRTRVLRASVMPQEAVSAEGESDGVG